MVRWGWSVAALALIVVVLAATLRDAKVFDVALTRANVTWEDVDIQTVDNDTALLTIHAFTKSTPDKVKNGLSALPRDAVKALIVDVRGCAGGLFESAVATTGLLLPVGAKVTLVKHRDGSEETLTAKGGPILEGLPTSVLIDGDTSSGCELFAGALQQDLSATLVGSNTFGKWSIQSVDELENHYAMKFTVATYYPPNGADPSGKGLTPDVPAFSAAGLAARLQHASLADRLREDPKLQAARNLTKLTE